MKLANLVGKNAIRTAPRGNDRSYMFEPTKILDVSPDGVIQIISSYSKKLDILPADLDDGNWAEVTDLATAKPTLAQLLARANDGYRAIDELVKNHAGEVEFANQADPKWREPGWSSKRSVYNRTVQGMVGRQLRAKQTTQTIIEGHSVTADGNRVKVGCEVFSRMELVACLNEIYLCGKDNSGEFIALRKGLMARSHTVSHESAQKLLGFLKG